MLCIDVVMSRGYPSSSFQRTRPNTHSIHFFPFGQFIEKDSAKRRLNNYVTNLSPPLAARFSTTIFLCRLSNSTQPQQQNGHKNNRPSPIIANCRFETSGPARCRRPLCWSFLLYGSRRCRGQGEPGTCRGEEAGRRAGGEG